MPALALCQVAETDSLKIGSFSGSLKEPVGVSVYNAEKIKISSSQYIGVFASMKFAVISEAQKNGRNYSEDLGAIINAIYTTEDHFYESAKLDNGGSVSIQAGPFFSIYDNIYMTIGLGVRGVNEYAQYYSEDLGGKFYFRTKTDFDILTSIGLSTIIQDKFFIQLGLDIFPDYDHKNRKNNENTLNRLFEHGSITNLSFSLGHVF